MSEFFIRRPIAAIVISILMVVLGLLVLKGIPVSQYPPITPPMVQITALYSGANAVNGGFDASVEQLNHHDKHHRAAQQGHLDPSLTQPKSQRQQDDGQYGLLSKGRFSPAGLKTLQRVATRVQDARQTFAVFLWIDVGGAHEEIR
jgi:hypothetical protein